MMAFPCSGGDSVIVCHGAIYSKVHCQRAENRSRSRLALRPWSRATPDLPLSSLSRDHIARWMQSHAGNCALGKTIADKQ
jgi:hypothetical protein